MSLLRPRIAAGMVPLSALARGAPTLARNLLGTFSESARARTPAFVTWGLTNRCPLQCRHCDMGKPIPEMTTEQRVAFAHQLGKSETWAVSVIGGEITVVPELAELVGILKQHQKHVSISTSGIGLHKHLDRLIEAGVDSYTISVDSHDAKEHDAFRGRPGLFASVLESVEKIRAARKDGAPALQVRCTINKTNFRKLPEYMAFWQPKVDNVVLQIIQENGLHQVRDRAVMFAPGDRAELTEVLAGLRHLYPFLRTRHSELMTRYVYEPEQLYRDLQFRCLLVPATSFAVMPDGDVRLCAGRKDSIVGNVLQNTIEEIWASSVARQTQRTMQSRTFGCMCWEQASSGNLELLAGHRVLEKAVDLVRGPR